MAIEIKKASRSRVRLKIGINGTPGSGKSFSALKIARGLIGKDGKLGAIDSENGSLSLYAHVTDFDVYDLNDFAPEKYVEAIHAFEAAGYDALIIDSGSHAWKYILDQKAALDARGGNNFTNWKLPKERYAKLTTAVLQSNMHIVYCMRSNTEFVQAETGRGYVKAGTKSIAEPDSEYEFTVVFSMGMDHRALAGIDGQGKDRTGIFANKGAFVPDESTGQLLAEWLDGATNQSYVKPSAATVAATPPPAPATAAQSPTAAYLRDTMQLDRDGLTAYRERCTGNGFDSKDVTPVLMAVGTQEIEGAFRMVAIMVGLRDMGINPDVDSVVAFLNAVPEKVDALNVLDQAAKFAVAANIADLVEYAKTFDDTPAVDEKKTKAKQTKPAEAAA